MSEIEIVEVTTKNYSEFMDMIHWRVTGKRVSELRRSGELPAYTNEELSYGECLDTDYFFVYAAKMNNEMVGYINASIIPKPDNRKGTLFIDEVWTQPTYRNKGIAKQLVHKMIELGKQLNMWECRLTFDLDNPASRRVYAQAGFSEKECLFGRLRLDNK